MKRATKPARQLPTNAEIGDRVFVIRDADAYNVRLIGFGKASRIVELSGVRLDEPDVYAWEKTARSVPARFGPSTRLGIRVDDPRRHIIDLTVEIELDDGRIVYGSNHWWGPENEFASVVKDRVVTQIRR